MSSTLTLIRGDDYSMVMHFTNEDGTDVNITGQTVFFTVKDINSLNPSVDTDAVITKTITSHSDPTHGKTILILTATQTNVEPGNYVYDFQMKTVGGEIHSSKMGTLIIKQDVTKRTS